MREGEIDPFDKVAQEGSSLRRDLIEVDEIFAQHHASQFGGTQRTRATSKPDASDFEKTLSTDGLVPKAISPGLNKDQSSHQNGPKGPGLVVGNGQLFLAQPGGVEARVGGGAQVDHERPRIRNPKIYHLMDERGRVQGPLAARDILRLYYKGVVGPGIFVVRRDSKIRIPVGRFVAVLSRQQGSDPMPQGGPGRGHHPALHRSVRPGRLDWAKGPLEVVGRRPVILGIPTSLVAGFLVIAALMFGAAAAWLVLSSAESPKAPRRERNGLDRREEVARGGISPKSRVKNPIERSGRSFDGPENRASLLQGTRGPIGPSQELRSQPPRAPSREESRSNIRKRDSRVRPQSGDRLAKSSSLRAKTPSKAEQRSRAQIEPARPRPRPAISVPRRPIPNIPARVSVSRSAPTARPLISPRPQVPSPKPMAAPRPAVRPAPPPVSAGVPASPASAGQSAWNDGQTVSGIGPFTFNRSAVAKCQAACTVSFNGPMGVVTGKFFKSIWGPILMEKNGPVRLSGLIRKSGSGIKIIISDIQ